MPEIITEGVVLSKFKEVLDEVFQENVQDRKTKIFRLEHLVSVLARHVPTDILAKIMEEIYPPTEEEAKFLSEWGNYEGEVAALDLKHFWVRIPKKDPPPDEDHGREWSRKALSKERGVIEGVPGIW